MKQKQIKASQSLRSGPLLSFGKCGRLFNLDLLTVLHLFLLIQTWDHKYLSNTKTVKWQKSSYFFTAYYRNICVFYNKLKKGGVCGSHPCPKGVLEHWDNGHMCCCLETSHTSSSGWRGLSPFEHLLGVTEWFLSYFISAVFEESKSVLIIIKGPGEVVTCRLYES